MPLVDGCSPEIIAANIRELVDTGQSPEDAVALAFKHAQEIGCDVGLQAVAKVQAAYIKGQLGAVT